MAKRLRVATRGSTLARWQAEQIALRLGEEVEFVIVQTTGDLRKNTPISEMGGKGVFVKEVQVAVMENRADVAIHSAKDLPSRGPEALCFGAILDRGDPRDVLIGGSLNGLPAGARVATGSARRIAQLAALRPDFTFVELRGNIEKRLDALRGVDAVVMAGVALERLGLLESRGNSYSVRRNGTSYPVHYLSPTEMLPQVGQGVLAVECRMDDQVTQERISVIDVETSRQVLMAERSFLAEVGANCEIPIGAYATREGGEVEMRTLLASLDGRIALRQHGRSSDGVALGRELARKSLYEDGGSEMLTWFTKGMRS